VFVDIRSSGIVRTPAVKSHAVRCLQFALSPIRGQVRRVVVRLYDASGPHGGSGNGCRIRIVLKERGEVMADEIEGDLYFAIDRAADRAGRAVLRAANRRSETL
jgi:putative sigma-54 modulation protein